MRQGRETCSCYPVPRKVAHRRAPQKPWSSHPLPTLAPTLSPPASSQKHLPTPVGPIQSPSKKMPAVAKRPCFKPASHLSLPHLLQPGPLPLPAHQTQLYLGCGSSRSCCGPTSSVCLSPLFTTAAWTCPAPLPARFSAACMLARHCSLWHVVCGPPPRHPHHTALLTSVHTRAGMAIWWEESCHE